MVFQDAIKTCFGKFATFSGRAPRSEYWWWVLFIILGNFVSGFLDGIVLGLGVGDGSIIGALFGLATLLPTIAVTARRLHDVNRSGWWQVAPYGMLIVTAIMAAINAAILQTAAAIAAVVLLVALLVWLVRAGTTGTNGFGPDPLGGSGEKGGGGTYHRSSIPPSGRD